MIKLNSGGRNNKNRNQRNRKKTELNNVAKPRGVFLKTLIRFKNPSKMAQVKREKSGNSNVRVEKWYIAADSTAIKRIFIRFSLKHTN